MEFFELGVYGIEARFRGLMIAMEVLSTPKNECLLDYGGSAMARLPRENEEFYLAMLRHFAEATETQLFSPKDMEWMGDIVFFWSLQPRVVQLLFKVMVSDLSHLQNMSLDMQKEVAKVWRPWLHAPQKKKD